MRIVFAITGLFIMATTSTTAFGFRKYLDQFSEHYDANSIPTVDLTDSQACGICHVRPGGGGKRTPFGEDFKRISLGEGTGFPGIEFLDSDQDGYVNLEEIFLQTSPGNADSAPQGRIELRLEGNSILTGSSSVNCSEMELMAFGFKFANGTNSVRLANTSLNLDTSIEGNNGVVLAKCAKEGLVGSVQK